METGMSLLEQGTRMLLEGLLKDLKPQLLELENQIIDLNLYQFPEMLPNGDIIIRRKTPKPPTADAETDI